MNSRKKILFMVGGNYVGGAEITNFNLIRDLHQQGFDILVVVNGWNDGDFIKRLTKENIPFHCIKLGFIYTSKLLWTFDTIINYPKAMLQLRKILNDFYPDWIFHSSYRSFLMGYPLFRTKKNVYREHNNPLFTSNNKVLYAFLSKRIKLFICPSQTVKKTLCALKIPSEKINIIPSPLDPELRDLFSNKHCENTIPRVGIVGQIHKGKGFDFLFEELLRVRQEFELFIYGDDTGEYAKSLIKNKIPQKFLHKVNWMGYVKNRIEIYKHLDIVLFPSLSESFGRIIIEAAAFGIPTIASDIDCFKEIIKHGETGLIFKLSDTSELAFHLEQLLLNDTKRRELGENARTYVLNHFTSEKCTEKFKTLLNN